MQLPTSLLPEKTQSNGTELHRINNHFGQNTPWQCDNKGLPWLPMACTQIQFQMHQYVAIEFI